MDEWVNDCLVIIKLLKFSYKKELNTDMCYSLDDFKNFISEKSQSHKSHIL